MVEPLLDTLEVIVPLAPDPELRSALEALHARYREEAPAILGLIARIQAELDKKLTKRQRASAARHDVREEERESYRRGLRRNVKPAEVRSLAMLALNGLIENLGLLDSFCPPEL